jgi:DNA repair exonuclease SbcCD ATPase subunit
MKDLKIKYASAQNFLPFGPDGIELNFEKMKNIILIKGENKDAKQIDSSAYSEEFRISSNGTGKSSIQEIITFGLFGKTVKRPEKLGANDVVHNKVGKDCKVEIIWNEYKVVRTRKEKGKDKHSLRLWHSPDLKWNDETEITQGTMAATQKKIEDIIGLSYDTFVNMCIFTDDQRACFLECDNSKKKEIVENLLSLESYRVWGENAKEAKKEIKNLILNKSKEYQLLIANKASAEKRVDLTKAKESNWKDTKEKEISKLELALESKRERLKSTDSGLALLAYTNAQEKIKRINEEMPQLDSSKAKLESDISKISDRLIELQDIQNDFTNQYSSLVNKLKAIMSNKEAKQKEKDSLLSKEPGTKCDKCLGTIDSSNIHSYVEKIDEDIKLIDSEIESNKPEARFLKEKLEENKAKIENAKEILNKAKEKMNSLDSKLKIMRNEFSTASQIREPKADSDQLLVEQQINELNSQIQSIQKELMGDSPFKEILENDEFELEKTNGYVEEKQKEIKELEDEIPYYDYWIKGFGENGIRKWIVDGIIPELNSRVNYWLQFLIDNKITLKFDNELNEKIERNPIDGNPYVYYAMSAGQRRRLNLSVSQSFAHIMMMSTGSSPSVVFLDEVTTNVDPSGVQGIYNMILELSEDKQVFITTHDPDLIRMLEGCEVLSLVHENGFTKLV